MTDKFPYSVGQLTPTTGMTTILSLGDVPPPFARGIDSLFSAVGDKLIAKILDGLNYQVCEITWNANNTVTRGDSFERMESGTFTSSTGGSAGHLSLSGGARIVAGGTRHALLDYLAGASPTFAGVNVVGDVTAGDRFTTTSPADYWSSGGVFNIANLGYLHSAGAFGLALSSNGYRNEAGGWTSLGLNGFVGGSQIQALPDGRIVFGGQSNGITGAQPDTYAQFNDSSGIGRLEMFVPIWGKSLAAQTGDTFDFEDHVNAMGFVGNARGDLTISGGAVTASKGYNRIFGQGSVADNLDTINGGKMGAVMTIRAGTSSQPITVRHNVGNILLDGGVDRVLSTGFKLLTLRYDDFGGGTWIEQSFTDIP